MGSRRGAERRRESGEGGERESGEGGGGEEEGEWGGGRRGGGRVGREGRGRVEWDNFRLSCDYVQCRHLVHSEYVCSHKLDVLC